MSCRLAAAFFFLAITSACSDGERGGGSHFPEVVPTSVTVAYGEPAGWELLWSAPVPVVSRIIRARLVGDTLIGLLDPGSCQLVLLDLTSPGLTEKRRMGRCGDGPGEFRAFSDFLIEGDTVIAADHFTHKVTFIPLAGGTVRVLAVDQAVVAGWRLHQLLSADRTAVKASGGLRGGGLNPADAFIRNIDRATGRVAEHAVPDAPIGAYNPASTLRRLVHCVDTESERIGIVSRWAGERAILDGATGAVLHRLTSDLDWIGTEERTRNGVVGQFPTVAAQIGCGHGEILVRWRGLQESAPYYLEILTADGAIRFQEAALDAPAEHPVQHSVVGRVADGWVFYTNDTPTGPMLYVMRPMQYWSQPGSQGTAEVR